MSISYYRRKRSLEISRGDDFLDRVIHRRGLIGCLNNAKWVKLIDTLVVHHGLIKECQVKLIWEEDSIGRLLCITEDTDYQFDYYDHAMEALITGKPHGWYAYREIEWLKFPCYSTEQRCEQDLTAIQAALATVGQLPLALTTDALRLDAYRTVAS